MTLWTIDLVIRQFLCFGFTPGQLGWIMQAELLHHTPIGLLTFDLKKAYAFGFGDPEQEESAREILPGNTPHQTKAFESYWEDAKLELGHILPIVSILNDPLCLWWKSKLDAEEIKDLIEWFWDNTPNFMHPVRGFSGPCPNKWLSLLITDGWSIIPDDLIMADWSRVDITVIAAMCALLGPEIMTQEVLKKIQQQGVNSANEELRKLNWDGSENEIYQVFSDQPEFRKLLEHLEISGNYLRSESWSHVRKIMEYLEAETALEV